MSAPADSDLQIELAIKSEVADHSPRHCQILDQTIGTQRSQAHSGAVTLIQRFGSAANLNIHLHCLVLDGVYGSSSGELAFHEVRGPTPAELEPAQFPCCAGLYAVRSAVSLGCGLPRLPR